MQLKKAIKTANALAKHDPARRFAVWHDLDYEEYRVSDGREVEFLVEGAIIRDSDIKYQTI